MRLATYIPTHNDPSAAIESALTVRDRKGVIVENGSRHFSVVSADNSLLRSDFRVVTHPVDIGRVANWAWCVDDLLHERDEWFRLLMAGDRIALDAHEQLDAFIASNPRAKFIVGQMHNVGIGTYHWKSPVGVDRLEPTDAMREVARRGNIFHGLSACVIHRDVLAGCSFGGGSLSFCADLFFLMQVAAKTTTYFAQFVMGEMVAEHRQTLYRRIGSVEHVLEESLVRHRAAEEFGRMTGNHQERDTILMQVANWASQKLELARV